MSGVFRAGLHLVRACVGQAFLFSLVLALLTNVPNTLLFVYADQAQPLGSTAFNVLVVGAMLLAIWLHGALIALLHAVAIGADRSLRTALRMGLRRYLAVVGCFVAYALIVILGYVALILPGLILMVTLLFAHFLVITEQLSITPALQRSHRLVWGYWWRTSIVFNVLVVISLAAFLVVGVLAGAAFYMTGVTEPAGPGMLVVVAIVVPLVAALLTPFLYACSYIVLADLQLRKEGLP
ncbi:MAG: hypothetical protein AAF993_09580 [Pseudomonadota bacterium]